MEELIKNASEENLLGFVTTFLGSYGTHGFQSLNKRDSDLLLFYSLECRGVLDSRQSNHETARILRLTPRRVAALRRDAWARWASRADVQRHLADTLRTAFAPIALTQVLKENRKSWNDDGLLPILLEHPSDHAEVEQFLKAVHCIPHYARNREVLLVPHDHVIPLLESMGDGVDAKRGRALNKAFSANTTLKKFLTKDISTLSWAQARAVLNNTVAAMLDKAAVDTVANGLSVLFLGILGKS